MSLRALVLTLRNGRAALVVLVAALLGVLAAAPQSQTVFGSLDKVLFDLVGVLFPARSSHHVVVVSADAKTIRELGVAAVFERRTHARLIDRLANASSITFDLLFPERGPDGFPFANGMNATL